MTVYKRRANRDDNEREIVKALRKMTAYVVQLNGPVDLLVGWRGVTVLFEVKNPKSTSSRGTKLTADEARFFEEWRGGPLFKIESPDEAIRCLEGVWKENSMRGSPAMRRPATPY